MDDAFLRQLIAQRIEERCDGLCYDPDVIGFFIVMAPDDGVGEVEAALGTQLLRNPVSGVEYGHPDFAPLFEYAGRHARWYELVFLGAGDEGVTLFVPRNPDVEPRLLALAAEYAVSEQVEV
ncbi:hypothetical protein [Zoogloea sp.]|uniref:hypothetical protein n=1 Tax=Zoogloea sp. TaxID=49181 RepID=UPI002610BFDB|nr:hypothetical protein [Zoogloea sp.]MDD3353136.1 hypothetical protein [Zoogloea sp.]